MLDELEWIQHRKMRELLRRVGRASNEEHYPTKPIALTDRSFEEVIRRFPLVVVDCWAAWCGPCVMIAPIIEELAKDYAGKVVFGKLNVDENPETATRFGIMSIPTLLILKSGKEVDRIVGVVPRRHIEAKLMALMI